ncbi:MAG: TrkH family potassium uptake protein [bacterium]|nr:TrkH family potassium uptake protein [bacterium]
MKTALKFRIRKQQINAPRLIVLSFAAVILVGTFLLMCPFSSSSGQITPFLSALFTATSATCVTGLTVEETGTYFSFAGQFIILLLIQIGGLGFMTILSITVTRMRRKMSMRNRIILSQSLSLDSADDIREAAQNLIKFVAFIEGIGAVILLIRFLPLYGVKGIWYAVFHSVSAFCNAGFDILGSGDSIMQLNNDLTVMLTLAFLIIFGGIGFLVFEDIYRKRLFNRLSVYSRLVLTVTAVLITAGTVIFFVMEYGNDATMADMPMWQKGVNSFFQSVTCRTAGFDSIGQSAMKDESKLVSVLLMMVGGASGSTAGGIKVATIGVIVLAVVSALRSREQIVLWGRSIPQRAVNNAMLLLAIWFMLVMSASVYVSFSTSAELIDALFEVCSAYATVGLSVGVTADANVGVRVLLILYMFFGRVGITTISLMFITRGSIKDKIRYPEGRIIIG